jgi:methionyl aminopeptidase
MRAKLRNVPLHGAADIEQSRTAGGLAARVLHMLVPHVQPGVSTGHLDQLAHDFIVQELRCVPTNVGYHGFPKTVCTSPNHVICHGIPDDRQILREGDILNIDVAVTTPEGWIGDTSRMYYVGQPSNQARRLVETTYEACWPASAPCAPAPRWAT